MSQTKHRILIVDDESKYVNSLTAILKASGYGTLSASDGIKAVEVAELEQPDLILLDVRMPGLDGCEACRQIREFSRTPIIMLTALSQKSDIVRGLESGADDYLTKPFSTDELLARVQAALRRAGYSESSAEPPFESGGLRVDYASSRVFVDGDEIRLTHTEYYLLCELTRAAGRVVSAETILENVWGAGHEGENQLVQRTMNRLRAKIEPNEEKTRFILTRPGLGYIIEK
jgi:DNA-binding response OmpR family regulator